MHKSITSSPKYFEAIIQLRPYDDTVLTYIEDEISKRGPEIFISKIEELKTGVDIYISSQRFARSLGDKLKKKFNGELKITRTLHHTDRLSSRLLYRATILFRVKRQREDD